MERKIGDVKIELKKGDIARQDDVEAVVNAANKDLLPGGGVAGAIHQKAGPELEKATRQYAPIKPGEAVVTAAFDLPNDHVIHCLGPVYGQDSPEDELLSSCYKEVLRLAETNKIESVCFPAISTGAFGYPMKEAAEIALGTVVDQAASLETVKHIRFVFLKDEALSTHEKVLDRCISNKA